LAARFWIVFGYRSRSFRPLGTTAGVAFPSLGVILVVAGVGSRRRRFWGWALTAIIVATQVLGSLVNATKGDFLRGGVGFLLSGALLYFLLRRKVRAAFTRQLSESTS